MVQILGVARDLHLRIMIPKNRAPIFIRILSNVLRKLPIAHERVLLLRLPDSLRIPDGFRFHERALCSLEARANISCFRTTSTPA